MKVFGFIADLMSTDGEKIRDGTLGVRWIATVVMDILLFVSSFDVN